MLVLLSKMHFNAHFMRRRFERYLEGVTHHFMALYSQDTQSWPPVA